MKPGKDIQDLIAIMARLRTPEIGCPWDLEQDFGSIAPYTIEEAYEVADAIERGDFDDLKDELGDLLLQVVFHAQMADRGRPLRLRRRGRGDHHQADPPPSACLRRRRARDAAAVKERWDEIKAEEKAERAARRPHNGERAEATGAPRRRAGRPPRPDARREASEARRQGRLRLERRRAPSSRRSARRSPRSKRSLQSRNGTGARSRTSSATSSSPSPISRATSRSSRRRRSGAPTPSSSAASAISRRSFSAAAGRSQDASLDEMEALWGEAKALERRRSSCRLTRSSASPTPPRPRRARAAPIRGSGASRFSATRTVSRARAGLRVVAPLQHLGVLVEPGRGAELVRAELDRHRRPPAGQRALDRLKQVREALAADRRNEHGRRLGGRRALAGAPRAATARPVDLVPHLEDAAVLARIDAELAEHLHHVLRLLLRLRRGDVADVQDEVGLQHLFERGAEGGDEHRRQIGDEADRVGEDRPPRRAAAARGEASGRASRRACPWRGCSAPVSRLKSVDLPAFV